MATTTAGALEHPMYLALKKTGEPRPNRGSDFDVMFRCPAHDDQTPSLHATWDHSDWTLHCFAGCEYSAVRAALDLPMDYAFDIATDSPRVKYRQDDRQWFDEGDRVDGLFGSHDIEPGDIVVITEGETDAQAVIERGGKALTPGNCKSWRPHHADYIRSLSPHAVYLCEDNDHEGRHFVSEVGNSLRFDPIPMFVCLFRRRRNLDRRWYAEPKGADIREALDRGDDLLDILLNAADYEEWVEYLQHEALPDDSLFYSLVSLDLICGLTGSQLKVYSWCDSVQGTSGLPARGALSIADEIHVDDGTVRTAGSEMHDGAMRIEHCLSASGNAWAATKFYVAHNPIRGRINFEGPDHVR